MLVAWCTRRYELECKYTQFVQLHSRSVVARLDLTPLATVLNSMEEGLPEGTYWCGKAKAEKGRKGRPVGQGHCHSVAAAVSPPDSSLSTSYAAAVRLHCTAVASYTPQGP